MPKNYKGCGTLTIKDTPKTNMLRLKTIKPEDLEKRKKNLKTIPAVKPIINKYNNKEKLTEEDYKNLVIYKDMMKNNTKLKQTIEKIDEIINRKFEKKEEIKPEIKQDEKPKKRITEEEIKENEKLLNDKPEEEKPVQIPGKKRGRPKSKKNKPEKQTTKKKNVNAEYDAVGDGIKKLILKKLQLKKQKK